jgi:hypothetical protein
VRIFALLCRERLQQELEADLAVTGGTDGDGTVEPTGLKSTRYVGGVGTVVPKTGLFSRVLRRESWGETRAQVQSESWID